MITLDSTSTYAGGTSSVFSWSHTCSGTNRLLVVSVSVTDGFGITSVTYNGVSMTRVGSDVQNTQPGDDPWASQWYLVAPATGTNTVEVTVAATPARTNAGAVSLNGVNQTTPLNAENGATGSSTSASVSVTTTVDNCWLVDCVSVKGATTPSPSGGQTSIHTANDADNSFGASYKGPETPTGSKSMTWTISSSPWAHKVGAYTPVSTESTGLAWIGA